jgi:DNA helicase HerA-like ATPase
MLFTTKYPWRDFVNTASQIAPAGSPVAVAPIGRVTSISGGQAKVTLAAPTGVCPSDHHVTVGRFLGIQAGAAVIIGLISAVEEDGGPSDAAEPRSVGRVELIGEIRNVAGVPRFQRGIESYPKIGDRAVPVTERELRIVYGTVDADRALIGDLQQSTSIGVHINIDDLVSRHFAVLGTTGVGKSSGVAILLQKVLSVRPNLRIFLVDPHNEYGQCFGDKAQVLTPRNLRLPFWLFNFEEIVDVIFGGRPGLDEEVEILSEVIPLAKGAYLQYRGADRQLAKKRDAGNAGFTADTPVPYRIEDLVDLLDQRMGKLENRSSRAVHHKLLSRIQTVRNHPRYAFMFENANLGGDTMADILAQLFRLPPDGKPMTIMQLAGFPAEVIDAVVSVLCRMAFDFGLWSDGVTPLLFVCEEAHRYAPADAKLGFGPTRRALSRIAKEGRKYGVYLGLVSQRPSEIDPTIMSQCSTLFVMRLSNERDQAFIRSAVSDAAQNLLSFIPSLGTREVFAFGSGIALPTRMRFTELPAAMRPNSEAGSTRSEAGASVQQDLIRTVIERWRSATMNYKAVQDMDFAETAPAPPAPLSSPAAYPGAPAPAPAPSTLDPRRQSILRRPLDAAVSPVGTAPANFRLK